MIKNYFFLLRQCRELNELLGDAQMAEVFTQEKEILMLHWITPDNRHVYTEICCSPQSAHILLRENFSRAKKNTIGFFPESHGQRLESIEIALFERVIRFRLTNGSFFYRIRGNQTNFFHNINYTETAFLKDETPASDYTQLDFCTPEACMEQVLLRIQNSTDTEMAAISRICGKELLTEVEFRMQQNQMDLRINLQAVLNEVFYAAFGLAAFTNPPSLLACPVTFIRAQNYFIRQSEAVHDIIRQRITEQFKIEAYKKQFILVQRHLQKELAFLSQKITNMQKVIADTAREIQYKKFGDMLLSNLHLVEEKTEKLLLPDFENEHEVLEIPLDTKLSPAHNAEVYYAKARNAHKQRQQFIKDLPSLEKKADSLNHMQRRLETVKELKEIEQLAEEVLRSGKNKEQRDDSPESRFRRFYVFDQYMILVGKDAHNNDILTVQYAKQNDFWFHARSVAGSHVVVRNEGNKETLDKTVLQAAASLAAYYSKAKSAKLVPVAYTQKKYVVKRKGMDPGQVGLLKEKVVMVKPEIPAICIPYGAKDAED